MKSYIGQSVPRVEDPALVIGAGRFVDDIRRPGQLEAAFLRSPVAHGLIKSIDARAARALPGVHAVYTLADLRPRLTADRLPLQFPSKVLPPNISPFILASREVAYVGEAIALVVADDRYIAEDAAALIDVDIQDLPPASDCREAMADTAPKAHVDRKSNVLTEFIWIMATPTRQSKRRRVVCVCRSSSTAAVRTRSNAAACWRTTTATSTCSRCGPRRSFRTKRASSS